MKTLESHGLLKTAPESGRSLASALAAAGDLSARSVLATEASATWGELLAGSALDGRGDELRGRSVLVATREQLTAVRALLELDGVAARIVLYPPDLPLEHLAYVIDAAAAEVLVSDRVRTGQVFPGIRYFMPCQETVAPIDYERGPALETEWILLTSGTTGPPKLVVHTLASLAGAIGPGAAPASPAAPVWSTFYDMRRYGGLQIFLRAALTGASLVLSSAQESAADFLLRAAAHGVTHISGTPSHWRRALMCPAAPLLAPRYVRLSGEIADQAILNHLRAAFPEARIAHAFASTEAGLAFDVEDGLTGFPADVIARTPGVEMKVEDGSLRIRSSRAARCYLGGPPLQDADGFVDTSDLLELRAGRYHFVGRRDGVINVGGLKVHPEEVEAVINRHPRVQMSLVRAKKNPITGALVVADVVLKTEPAPGPPEQELQRDILVLCREALSSHKVPTAINVVATLAVAETGKLVRRHA